MDDFNQGQAPVNDTPVMPSPTPVEPPEEPVIPPATETMVEPPLEVVSETPVAETPVTE